MPKLTQNRLSAYRIMWLFVFFDLPTNTPTERKNAAHFRKKLLKQGFQMMQYSVYKRHCWSHERADKYTRRVECEVPPYGEVSILRITDKQYASMRNFYNTKCYTAKKGYSQLSFF